MCELSDLITPLSFDQRTTSFSRRFPHATPFPFLSVLVEEEHWLGFIPGPSLCSPLESESLGLPTPPSLEQVR